MPGTLQVRVTAKRSISQKLKADMIKKPSKHPEKIHEMQVKVQQDQEKKQEPHNVFLVNNTFR